LEANAYSLSFVLDLGRTELAPVAKASKAFFSEPIRRVKPKIPAMLEAQPGAESGNR